MDQIRIMTSADTEVFGGFAAVSGLAVSCAKTKAIPLGTWDPAEFPLPFDYVDNCRILDVIFARTVPDMMNLTWTKVVSAANAVVHANYGRTLNLVQKRQQPLVVGWLWAGSFFRVPFRLVCAPRSAGGLGLLHPYWKAQSLFIGRWLACLVQDSGSFAGTILEVLADKWPLTGDASSCQIPDSVIHYREYFKSRKDRVLALPLDEGVQRVGDDRKAIDLQLAVHVVVHSGLRTKDHLTELL
ncbi:Innexin-2 [Frankliniella fusca]|uniref:Innexin-2 n=1 Tax=Frankliniella fusca TaxID=407009 RepID=A0AAE1H581_9NEOP|nr:Innexin-2 [Frankliniella fusca]